MGDRANIEFKEVNGGKLFFYTHWRGFEYMKSALKNALERNERWDDDQYLARIIFCEVIKDAHDETTGFGLSTTLCDNNNSIIEVDVKSQTVKIEEDIYSFQEFIESF